MYCGHHKKIIGPVVGCNPDLTQPHWYEFLFLRKVFRKGDLRQDEVIRTSTTGVRWEVAILHLL